MKKSEKYNGVAAASRSPMALMGSPRNENEEENTSMRTAETMLRLVPMALGVTALVVMLKNSQSNEFGSLSYSDLGAFRWIVDKKTETKARVAFFKAFFNILEKFLSFDINRKLTGFAPYRYLVHANGICAGYSLLSAIIAAMPRPSTMPRAWSFFLLDQILTYLILAAGAVSTEVLYLASKGDAAITWSAACGTFGGFCHKATTAVIITFIVVICYTLLSLISSYRLFSKFDAPVNYPSKSVETTVFHG